MSRRSLAWLMVLALCLGMILPAQAANVFSFTEKTVTLFEGETYETALRREGTYGGDAEIVYSSAKPGIATVSEDGVITAVSKGETTVAASLRRNGKRVGKTQITVKVRRAVTKVTLSTEKLSVYEMDDPAVADLLQEETEYQVLVVPAGSAITLNVVCTPETASSKQVTFTTSDAGVAKIVNGKTLKAIQHGECDLEIRSALNPEVTETFHVLVIQPVKKIQINAGSKKVAAGSVLQLTASCTPENASIQEVTWSSKNPAVADVDEDGMVTGRKKGTVSIVATAADGSNVTAVVSLAVTQPVSSISFQQTYIPVVAGRTVQPKYSVYPADASDKSVTWTTSDATIATVQNGKITGRKAGTCMVTCTSKSNPEIAASAMVTVSQLVTKIECTTPQEERSLIIGDSLWLQWDVLPWDATNKALTFKSQQPKIATVDADGTVTALSRGTATIVATAADGSKKQGSVKISVIQPVTGVSIQKPLYYVQRGEGATVRAVVEPKNANNQKVYWTTADDRVATVKSSGASTGYVYGVYPGYTTVTACTEDGGYVADTRIRVGEFNDLVMIEDLEVNANNQIRIVLRNMSRDITLGNIFYIVECYDLEGNPMICNKDGESTGFVGEYPFELLPYERTTHGAFRFRNYVIDQEIGAVVLTLTGWEDTDGVTWNIPEDERPRVRWDRNPNRYGTEERDNQEQKYNYDEQGEGVG